MTRPAVTQPPRPPARRRAGDIAAALARAGPLWAVLDIALRD